MATLKFDDFYGHVRECESRLFWITYILSRLSRMLSVCLLRFTGTSSLEGAGSFNALLSLNVRSIWTLCFLCFFSLQIGNQDVLGFELLQGVWILCLGEVEHTGHFDGVRCMFDWRKVEHICLRWTFIVWSSDMLCYNDSDMASGCSWWLFLNPQLAWKLPCAHLIVASHNNLLTSAFGLWLDFLKFLTVASVCIQVLLHLQSSSFSDWLCIDTSSRSWQEWNRLIKSRDLIWKLTSRLHSWGKWT